MTEEQQEHMIPKSRLDAKNRIIEELQAELAGTKDQAQKAAVAAAGWQSRAESLQEIAKERDNATAELGRLRATHAEDLAMIDAGITDPDAMSIVRQRHKEGTDFAAHLQELKASPPPILASFFQPAAAAADGVAGVAGVAGAASKQAQPLVARTLPGNEKTTPPPGPVGEWDPKAIRENYKEHRSELLDTKVV